MANKWRARIEETDDGWTAGMSITRGNYIVTCRAENRLDTEAQAKNFLKAFLLKVDSGLQIADKKLAVVRLEENSSLEE